MQQEKQEHALEALIQRFNDENHKGAASQDEPEETYHIYPVPGGMVILKEEPQIINAPPPQNQPPSQLFTYAILFFAFFLPLSAILFQLHVAYNPPIASVTIIPTVQTFTLKSRVHIGRLIHSVTLSQTQTIPTTGKGHQDETRAAGTVTLYNGQFQRVTISAGTILTSASGMQIATDQDAIIPAANPPNFGQVTISAHAVHAGNTGNIPAYDINAACCFASVLAKNPENFTGGQDARDFQTVAKADITNASTALKTLLSASTKGALQGQLQPGEAIGMVPCNPLIATDHQPGDEATTVTVTVSETCTAAAYNKDALQRTATQLVTSQALQRLGEGYSLFGESHVTVTQITTTTPTPTLTFSSQGSFLYGLSLQSQERMKTLIAGKTTQEAEHLLTSLPGVARVSMQWGDDTKLPKDTRYIHITLVVV